MDEWMDGWIKIESKSDNQKIMSHPTQPNQMQKKQSKAKLCLLQQLPRGVSDVLTRRVHKDGD